MNGIVLGLFGGPGGWPEGARGLGLQDVGIELDEAACQTRRAAGHGVIRADVSKFPVEQLAGKVWGQCDSPPCIVFSAAGDRGGTVVLEILATGIRDAFAGRKTRALRRREMAHALRVSSWGGDQPGRPCHETPGKDWKWSRKEQDAWKRKLRARKGSPAALRRDMAAAGDGRHPTRARRSAKIWAAVRSASLVIEPARFMHAGKPEWVALEQVPAVLPLWQVYAEELAKLGYHTWVGTLNSADYGVPQTRIRAILIASRTRKVYRPEPTHYDPRKGMQLWGTPWVSMSDALGWGATGRPGPAVTAGGTSTGGAEPFPTRARNLLEAERDAGNWILHTNRGQAEDGSRQTADPRSAPAPAPAPAPALTAKSGGQWFLRKDAQANAAMRPAPAPAPTISFGHASGEMRWVFRNNNNNNACVREMDEPAGTLFFSNRSNWAAWVQEPVTSAGQDEAAEDSGRRSLRRSRGASVDRRDHPVDEPAPTITGAGGKPGGNLAWVDDAAKDSVRITVEEAAVLQSFPADYPFQGSKTAQFRQVGDAVPPLLAMHVVAMATGIKISAREAA